MVRANIIVVWLIITVTGFLALEFHSRRSGAAVTQAKDWSAQAQLALVFDQPNLLVFVHPHCGCTFATLTELDHLMTKIHGKTHLNIIFYKPKKFAKSWVETASWNLAQQIPNARLMVDEDGALAKMLEVRTSGQILLYGTKQNLVYAGGLVPRRGHTGDSPGQQFVLDYFQTGSATFTAGLVYGCSLVSAKLKITDVF